jgi:hypothetical protein
MPNNVDCKPHIKTEVLNMMAKKPQAKIICLVIFYSNFNKRLKFENAQKTQ